MLTALHLKSASSRSQSPLSLPLVPSVTIFVGPNNSGKSLLLREIRDFCKTGAVGPTTLVLDRLECNAVDRATAELDLAKMKRPKWDSEVIQKDQMPVWVGGERDLLLPEFYFRAREKPDVHTKNFARWHLGPSTLSLDGASRIDLLKRHEKGDLKFPVQPLARIFTDDTKRARWQKIVHEAFGLYPGIDAAEGSNFSVRFGRTPPTRERSLEDDILQWMRDARGLEAVSDGVRAYAGILLQIYAGDPTVMLIDEPEAFLHPSLARSLGRELASAARSENKFVFVATHSADFVMGAIQSGATINIIRLTWSNDTATARVLPSTELASLMNDPMLRSVGVLSGLFFQNVIVTEGDTDRAFYQEINERLGAVKDNRAIPHALFLNAENHQTIPAIVAPLRKLGIAVAGIADLDVIKRGGHEWTRQLEACGVPSAQHQSSHSLRDAVLKVLVAAAPDGAPKSNEYFKTAGGLSLLPKTDREAAENFCDDLAKYGLFIVRSGEVEAWLKHLGVPPKTNGWRAKIFEAMGSDPSQTTYAQPSTGDVWDFMGSINSWLADPARRGIPD